MRTFSKPIDAGFEVASPIDPNARHLKVWGYSETQGILSSASIPRDLSRVDLAGAKLNARGITFDKLALNELMESGHNCAIDKDGEAYCWGRNAEGQLGSGDYNDAELPVKVAGGYKWTKLTLGTSSSCGIRDNGEAYCWGLDNSGQLGNGAGGSTNTPGLVAGGHTYIDIASGEFTVCGLIANGNAYCWGSGASTTLGNGSLSNVQSPTATNGGRVYRAISMSRDSACAITAVGDDGYCWGGNYFGALGEGTNGNRSTPTLVLGGHDWSYINVGQVSTCGMTTGGANYCWGSYVGDWVLRPNTPELINAQPFTSITVGKFHMCGLLADNTARCWGSNYNGYLGNGTTTSSLVTQTVAVTGAYTWKEFSARGDHSCGITTDNEVRCVGTGNGGRFGNGSVLSTSPKLFDEQNYLTASADTSHACGVRLDGTLYCWGAGGTGQLGQGANASSAAAVGVGGGLTWKTVSVQNAHTCAISTDHHVYCWGTNTSGQLGDGTSANKNTPTAINVPNTLQFQAIASGHSHTCALTTTGAAYCWGLNTYGQLGRGLGNTTASLDPVAVSGGHVFAQISASTSTTCGVTTTGDGYCWGRNNTSQLGNGLTAQLEAPNQIAGAWSRIDAGATQTCGVRTNGDGYCWGANANGTIGDGSVANRTTPALVNGAHTWTKIISGSSHTCGLTQASEIYCWGQNLQGRLGVSTPALIQNQPTLVDDTSVWSDLVGGQTITMAIAKTLPIIEFEEAEANSEESDGSVDIAVSISRSPMSDVTVQYEVIAGSATGGGVDYTLGSGTLTFPKNYSSSRTISLSIVDDGVVEGKEGLMIRLHTPSGATIGIKSRHTHVVRD